MFKKNMIRTLKERLRPWVKLSTVDYEELWWILFSAIPFLYSCFLWNKMLSFHKMNYTMFFFFFSVGVTARYEEEKFKPLNIMTLLNCVVKTHWDTNLQLSQPVPRLEKIIFCHLQKVLEYHKSAKLWSKFALLQNKYFRRKEMCKQVTRRSF